MRTGNLHGHAAPPRSPHVRLSVCLSASSRPGLQIPSVLPSETFNGKCFPAY